MTTFTYTELPAFDELVDHISEQFDGLVDHPNFPTLPWGDLSGWVTLPEIQCKSLEDIAFLLGSRLEAYLEDPNCKG
jgi:hypothetical protein